MAQELRHVIYVEPLIAIVAPRLPPEFVQAMKPHSDSPKFQHKSFRIWVRPLTHREYKQFNTSRYEMRAIMQIFNTHIEIDDGANLAYLMKWPILVKAVMDAIFDISGEQVEQINSDPKVMFESLKKRRDELSRNEALMDRFVMLNAGFEFYTGYYSACETLEQRLDVVAALELITSVHLEQRWEFARKRNMPIKLSPDKNFDREYKDSMGNAQGSQMAQMFDESERELAEAMRRDKRSAELGIKTRVNTASENKELEDN